MRGTQYWALWLRILAIATDEIVAPVMPSTSQGWVFSPCLTGTMGLASSDRSSRSETSRRSKFARNAGSVSILSPSPGVSLLSRTWIPTMACSANEYP